MSTIVKYTKNSNSDKYMVIGAEYVVINPVYGLNLKVGFKFKLEGFSEDATPCAGMLLTTLNEKNLGFTNLPVRFVEGSQLSIIGGYYSFKLLSTVHYRAKPFVSQCGIDPKVSTDNVNLVTCKNCLKSMGIPYV